MNRLLLAVTAALTMGGATLAAASEDLTALRQPAIDRCSDNGQSNLEPCTCMVDHIVAQFGEDAGPMLKILGAGLQPSDVAGIATLLGVSEADAQTTIARLNEKMDGAIAACSPK